MVRGPHRIRLPFIALLSALLLPVAETRAQDPPVNPGAAAVGTPDPTGAASDDCARLVRTALLGPGNEVKAKKFLQLQGELTLNRLAWALIRKDYTDQQFKVEARIFELIRDLDSTKYPEVAKARDQFRANPLSRRALARVLPIIGEILNEQDRELQDPLVRRHLMLGPTDFKLLAVLGDKEVGGDGKLHASFGMNPTKDSSILNFTKLINSAVRGRQLDGAAREKIAARVTELSIELDKLLDGLPLPEACREKAQSACCGREGGPDSPLVHALTDSVDEIVSADGNLRYGDFWFQLPKGAASLPAKLKRAAKPPENFVLDPEALVKYSGTGGNGAGEASPGDREAVETEYADRVLKRSPALGGRDELMKDRELLHGLIRAIEGGTATFDYHGERYRLPTTVNNPVSYGLRASTTFHWMTDRDQKKQILALVPADFPESRKDAFVRTWVDARFNTGQKVSFEFNGRLYPLCEDRDLKECDGRPVPTGKAALFAFKVPGVKGSNPAQDFAAISPEQISMIRHAQIRGEYAHVWQGKAFHNSGAPVDVKQEVVNFTFEDQKLNRNGRLTTIARTVTAQVSDWALSKLPDTPRPTVPLLEAFLKGRDTEENRRILGLALANQNAVFALENQVYRTSNFHPVTRPEMAEELNLFLGRPANTPEAQAPGSNDPEFQRAFFAAVMNIKPVFEFKGEHYLTTSVSRIPDSSKLVVRKGVTSYSERANMVDQLNRLGDKDLVMQYHRLYRNPELGCDFYSIIDKKTAQFEVHSWKTGEVLDHYEVLLGRTRGSDKRLKYTDYDRKLTNGSTSAGIFHAYDFRTTMKDSLYYDRYNDHLMAMMNEDGSFDAKHEPIMATHEVPEGLRADRNGRFANDNEADNYTTNGCPNLKAEDARDFWSKYAKADCPIYVLPEESRNRFMLQGGKLTFVRKDEAGCDEKAVNGCDRDYYYSPPSRAKEKPTAIKILVDRDLAKNPNVAAFVDTLTDPVVKKQLMACTGITNDEYAELAHWAFGAAGAESDFGNGFRFTGKRIYGAVWLAKQVTKNNSPDSIGLSQVKRPEAVLKHCFPNITKKQVEESPRAAAIAALTHLADDLKPLRVLKPSMRYSFLYYYFNGARGRVEKGTAAPDVEFKPQRANAYANRIQIFDSGTEIAFVLEWLQSER